MQQLAEHYANVQRTSLTQQFEHILDVYYEQKDQGMKIKLADLARRSGVNYASLRQAKVRYDRRKNTKMKHKKYTKRKYWMGVNLELQSQKKLLV